MTPAEVAAAARRPRAKKGEGDRLRAEILVATERLLVETESEDAVSIRAVADAIGVSPPAIYRHFADKATLLFEVCSSAFERMDQALMAAAADHPDDPLAVLRARAHAYLRFGTENPELYRIMFMGRSELTPEQYADEMLVGTGSFAHLVQAVQRVIDSGRLRPELTDAYRLSLSLWAAIHGVTSLAVAKPCMPGPVPADRLDDLLGLVVTGMLS